MLLPTTKMLTVYFDAFAHFIIDFSLEKQTKIEQNKKFL